MESGEAVECGMGILHSGAEQESTKGGVEGEGLKGEREEKRFFPRSGS